MLRNKNGLVRVYIPHKLRGTIKARKGGNKMQVIVLYLIRQLLKPLIQLRYHIFFNNLFISTKLAKYAHA